MSAPRITPLAKPTRLPRPVTTVVRKPPSTVGAIDVTAARTSSAVAGSTPSEVSASATAASTEAPIWSSCPTTPWTVPTRTTVTRPSTPRTTMPAAAVGLTRCRVSRVARGLKMTARTAANASGSTISFTAARTAAMTTSAAARPTKVHVHRPSRPTALLTAVPPARSVIGLDARGRDTPWSGVSMPTSGWSAPGCASDMSFDLHCRIPRTPRPGLGVSYVPERSRDSTWMLRVIAQSGKSSCSH